MNASTEKAATGQNPRLNQGLSGRLAKGLLSLGLALAASGAALAAPLISFLATPAHVGGVAGSTVGWGYQITNHSSDYFVASALNADSFQWGSPLSLFDFPVLAPGATVSQNFSANLAGLFQLSWDALAPEGSSNSGLFMLSGDFFSGDPLAGGQFIAAAPDAVASYSATLQPGSQIPEPGALLLSLTALGLLRVARRK